jgi:hypothetical protein
LKLQSPSFIVDIANSLESKPFATHGESTDLPGDPGPKLDKARNNREDNNLGLHSTPGNKQREGLPRSGVGQKRTRNGRDGVRTRLKPIRLKEKGLTESS